MAALKLLGAPPSCRARDCLPCPSLSFPISNPIAMARVTRELASPRQWRLGPDPSAAETWPAWISQLQVHGGGPLDNGSMGQRGCEIPIYACLAHAKGLQSLRLSSHTLIMMPAPQPRAGSGPGLPAANRSLFTLALGRGWGAVGIFQQADQSLPSSHTLHAAPLPLGESSSVEAVTM